MEVAAHLNSNLLKFERSLISQLRLGILPLRIETGRFIGLEVQERLCEVCDNNQVEDEAHFLFDCETYNDLRNDMETAMNIQLDRLNFTEKLEVIFKHPYSLGRYVNRAMNIRKAKLYK